MLSEVWDEIIYPFPNVAPLVCGNGYRVFQTLYDAMVDGMHGKLLYDFPVDPQVH